MELAGKVAVVIGGSGGIGAATCRVLAGLGADVAVGFHAGQARAEAIVASLPKGRHAALQVAIEDSASIGRFRDAVLSRFGRIDILVNSAGVLALGPVEQMSLADLDRTLDVNVRAVFVGTQAALRHMGEGGRIITIGSTNAERMPFAGGAAYAMSKSAIVGLTRGLARDLGPRGITVNNVQPGPVDTDMNPADGPMAAGMHSFMALQRHGTGDEIAGMVAYLAGPEAGFVTGASLTIDGGFAA